MKQAKNALCQPKGFKASAAACGLKKANALDLALIYSEVPAVAYGLFTKNTFIAAPVVVCKRHLKNKSSRAIIINSGNANCYTGKEGLKIAVETACSAAKLLRVPEASVLIASTGIIGKLPDFSKIKNALPHLVASLNRNDGDKVALAIMTTDTKPKELTAKVAIGDSAVTIGAVAKGAGMIAPDMATMLCFITTDAAIEYRALQEALRQAVNNSFNMITIDGCMSTNDSVIILANGLAGNKMIAAGSDGFIRFSFALTEICLGLAKMIVADAEGATKFITIKVRGAKDNAQAKKAALAIANSNLFKTAVYGENPNWGRIIAAIGQSAVAAADSIGLQCSSLKRKNVEVEVDLKAGKAAACVYTSDLTPEYIRINAQYN